MKEKIGIVLLLCIGIVILAVLSRNAQPSSSLYLIKRAQENIILLTKIAPVAKVDYYEYLLNERLGEIQYIMNSHQYALIVSTALRYATTAGKLTEFASKNNLKNKTQEITKEFMEHKKILNTLSQQFPGASDRWKYVVDDENYLDTYVKELP